MSQAVLKFSDTVSARLVDDVLVVTIDNPPVNAASSSVRRGMMHALADAAKSSIVGVVLTGAGRNFCAGADVREFDAPPIEPTLTQLVNALEASNNPVVAALNGAALGGGAELALACHARVMGKAARIGFPEVTLGIVPGAGGTLRLPRLIGVAAAIDLIGTGRIIGAEEALRLALVDELSDDPVHAAIARVRALAESPLRRTSQLQPKASDVPAVDAAKQAALRKFKGRRAVVEAARLVELAPARGVDVAMADERATFIALRQSPEAKALRHVFFAERQAARIPEIADVAPRDVRVVGVVGIGQMGSAIATVALNAGYRVIAVEQSAAAAEAGRARVVRLIDGAAAKGRFDAAGRADRLARLAISSSRLDLAPCDLVIEAVFDDPAVKQALFAELSDIVRDDAILATNTSYLDPDAIAGAARAPQRVVGMHFFSPAHVMRLLEVVKCAATSEQALATAFAVGKAMGKLPILSGVGEGFIGNRIFSAYRRKAEILIEEGAAPQDVDGAMEAYGMAMGPFTTSDLAGLEIAWARRKRQAGGQDPGQRNVTIADRLCETGRFGQKAGRGWYDYTSGGRRVDPAVADLIAAHRQARNIAPRAFSDHEIQRQLVAAMAAEGRSLVAEGIARRASDIDLVFIHGYGFPAEKGGPMFARSAGAI